MRAMSLHHSLKAGPGDGAARVAAAGGDNSGAEAVGVDPRPHTTPLRGTGETRPRVLEASHKAMGSSLHPLAADPEVDLGAFLYACRRLPGAIAEAELVVLGQSAEVFIRHGFVFDPLAPQGRTWTAVDAPGR